MNCPSTVPVPVPVPLRPEKFGRFFNVLAACLFFLAELLLVACTLCVESQRAFLRVQSSKPWERRTINSRCQSNLQKGFNDREKLLKDFSGQYAFGDKYICHIDVFLAIQISNAIGKFNIHMFQVSYFSKDLWILQEVTRIPSLVTRKATQRPSLGVYKAETQNHVI
ncbi:hypothetical protein SDJN03_22563, partial [Cucurbita argyrosperma subsp. sororia]